MITATLQDLRQHGAKAISDTEVTYLIVNSKKKSVMVPPDQYEMLVEALEDLEDLAVIEARKHEKVVPFTSLLAHRKKR